MQGNGTSLAAVAMLLAAAPAVAACSSPDVAQSRHADTEPRVRQAIAEILGKDVSKTGLSASFAEDLGADSLDCVEIVMALEEKFGIEIADADVASLKTIGDAVAYVDRRRR